MDYGPGAAVGPYTLVRRIGAGGMGTVFEARDPAGRAVALKLQGSLAQADLERFHVEAQAAARLRHPGVVAIHSYGVTDAGQPYVAMEYVAGESLQARLEREGPLAPAEAAAQAAEVARIVASVHDEGVLHRDLKPANVLVRPDGRLALTDFGLARIVDQSRHLTQTGEVLGTPAFLSPEQARGIPAAVGRPSDVYGLGALLYALLTGRPPFSASGALELLHRVATAAPPRPSQVRPGVPAGLEAICLRCLEKDPRARFASAQELAAALDRHEDFRPRRRAPGWRALVAGGALSAVAIAAAVWVAERVGRLPSDELARRSARLARQVEDTLGRRRVAADLDDDLARWRGELEALRAGAPDRVLPADLVATAERLRFLAGVAALAQGSPDRARLALASLSPGSGAGPGDLHAALQAGLVATGAEPGADASAAEAVLERALASGLDLVDLRAWRARAAVQAGLTSPALAQAVVADLRATERARGLDRAERVALGRALLRGGGVEEGLAQLDACAPLAPAVRWEAALAAAELWLRSDPGRALLHLEALPPPPAAERARRRRLVQEAYAAVGSLTPRSRDARVPADVPALLRVAVALGPELPPGPEVEELLARATRPGRSDTALAAVLADLYPNARAIQVTAGQLDAVITATPAERAAFTRALARAVELTPDSAERVDLEVQLCGSLHRAQEHAEVIRAVTRVLPRLSDPRHRGPLLLFRARAQRERGSLAAALADIDEAIASSSEFADRFAERAAIYDALGDTDRALADVSQFFRLANEDTPRVTPTTELAWKLTREGRDRGPARAALERLIAWRVAPHPNWWVRLALLRIQDGDRAGALAALRGTPEDPRDPAAVGARALVARIERDPEADLQGELEALVRRLEPE